MPSKKSDFFNKVSAKCGYIGAELSERTYYAILKVILEEIKDGGEIYLPNWGKFRVRNYPPARRHMVWTKDIRVLPGYKVLEFIPYHKLKKYIKGKI